ncbi:winged helix-turn-helix transcriptional regulator [Allokutzneria albata]|uniref:DNA-binding transcriptional regulator, HxlR family n=1 Tax=Allokutzneria albata TaxID=211114 RepID=A0A1G9UA07_ALLAB|nr:helix-turn-helix domain-containing protein [Allokutzneria albata]SDM56771.1 DNA-binding transcriptional regulator, HxlR family [Allokutzneria albata]
MAREDAAGHGPAWTDPACPVARAADVVGDRWSLLIIRDAMDGARSFTDFQRRTGIARNILADRLRKLAAHGLISQVDAPSGKRRAYALTTAGKDLFPVIVTLRQWGERHAYEAGEPHSVLVDEHGAVVPPLVPVAADGRPLTSDTTSVDRQPQDRV